LILLSILIFIPYLILGYIKKIDYNGIEYLGIWAILLIIYFRNKTGHVPINKLILLFLLITLFVKSVIVHERTLMSWVALPVIPICGFMIFSKKK
jgi:uncharacterized membrane protein YpjA